MPDEQPTGTGSVTEAHDLLDEAARLADRTVEEHQQAVTRLRQYKADLRLVSYPVVGAPPIESAVALLPAAEERRFARTIAARLTSRPRMLGRMLRRTA